MFFTYVKISALKNYLETTWREPKPQPTWGLGRVKPALDAQQELTRTSGLSRGVTRFGFLPLTRNPFLKVSAPHCPHVAKSTSNNSVHADLPRSLNTYFKFWLQKQLNLLNGFSVEIRGINKHRSPQHTLGIAVAFLRAFKRCTDTKSSIKKGATGSGWGSEVSTRVHVLGKADFTAAP